MADHEVYHNAEIKAIKEFKNHVDNLFKLEKDINTIRTPITSFKDSIKELSNIERTLKDEIKNLSEKTKDINVKKIEDMIAQQIKKLKQ